MSFFGIDSIRFVKIMIYKVDDRFVVVLVRGDREVNEIKLKNFLGVIDLEFVFVEDVERIIGVKVGFVGLIGFLIDVYVDNEVKYFKNFVVGVNKIDYYIKNVNFLDFKVIKFVDFRNII